jgi:uncharacterized protein RhaS with RHS repeats
LQDLRARFYDPATGQFLTRDPLEERTQQPYAYVEQDPLNRVDPSGLEGELIAGGCAAGEAVEPLGGCAPGAALGAAGEGAKAGATVGLGWLLSELDSSDESSSADAEKEEECPEPWTYGTEMGDARETRTQDEQFVNKLETSAGSNPGSPYGNGPRGKQIIAAIGRLIGAIVKHGGS